MQHSNGHRHKTPAIARCFTFYTTVSPLRRKYIRLKIAWSIISESFGVGKPMILAETLDFQKPVTVFHRKSRVVTNAAVG